MHFHPSARFTSLRIIVFVGFCLLFMLIPAAAQDEQRPAPQFLYRDETISFS
jgi:hypothetical protein